MASSLTATYRDQIKEHTNEVAIVKVDKLFPTTFDSFLATPRKYVNR